MAALAALCMPHIASEQKLSAPIHSTLLDDFGLDKSLSCASRGLSQRWRWRNWKSSFFPCQRFQNVAIVIVNLLENNAL